MSDRVYVVVEDLRKENAALREALKKARWIARGIGYSMREFASMVGITPTQLSKWTDEVPEREPDFKD